MAAQVITTPRLKDKVLIDCIKELATEVSSHSPSATLSLLGSSTVRFDPLVADDSEELADLIKKNSELIFRASFSAGGFSVSFHRGGQSDPKSPYTDEVYLNPGSQCQLNESEKLQIAYVIVKKLKATDKGRTVGNKFSKEQEELASIHESTLSRLEELSEKLIHDNHEYRSKLDQEFFSRISSEDERFQAKEQELNAEYENLFGDLKNKESEFEEKKKELDNKSNTHARRQIRKDIIKEIKNRQTEFKLTAGTNKLRWPVGLAMLGLIAVFVVLASFSIRDFYQSMNVSDARVLWIAGVKQIIYSFGAVGSILFYIRWQNRWFEQHSLAEFHLKQLELDMERASWIVETSLEWNDAKGNTIPTELLESLSRNLFTEAHEKAGNLAHPADQLASALMGSASLVKLKAGDAELEIDPKKLKKSRNEFESSNK
ncbi:DUF485 domain-containing protein [Marinimicrobium alkaliphilum]|uniref:hypothetical protein n=1 Tax=Marinimicrobium alkaliphilum TaxID=2202654 RepID=UPI000DBA53FF|nr:hypothetical protein [Marinimicrobium alkaliphilum]